MLESVRIRGFPCLLDSLSHMDGVVMVLATGPNGPVARKLTDHTSFANMSSVCKYGEFWSMVGEDWVLESP